MISWQDAKYGRVTLEELVHINNYLDFVADVEYFAQLDASEKLKKNRGRR